MSSIEQELETIKTITDALNALDEDARKRALSYAMQHLGISTQMSDIEGADSFAKAAEGMRSPLQQAETKRELVDIRSLKELKKPATDVEMATLVAYYLKHDAPEDERKLEVDAEDIDKYFVQAGYPLPNNTQYTLPNAKKAGYPENASRGKYKLNSVGHNLIAHNMPRADGTQVGPAKKRKKASKKPTGTSSAPKHTKKRK